MKLNEFLESSEQLDEIKLRHALAGAALVGALATGAAVHKGAEDNHSKNSTHGKVTQLSSIQIKALEDKKQVDRLTKIVLDKYSASVSPGKAEEIVKLAMKHENATFPKAEHLLASIGIESSFDQNAKSNLKHDKAVGLTQIRPKIWGIHAKDLKGNLDKQVGLAAEILNKYYKKLGSTDKAVHAYNVGLTNVRHHKGLNPEYVQKWKSELKRYET